MRYLALLVLLSSTGCLASTVPDAPPAPDACPAVECAWTAESTCPDGAAFSSESTSLEIDNGATTCWVYNAVCVTAPVAPACVPDSCRQNRFTTCEPTVKP